MCGILGGFWQQEITNLEQRLRAGMQLMKHRGPDDEGIYSELADGSSLALAHTRLSIIDLSPAGHQPMQVLGRYFITYNGEIYNYIELREELTRLGYHFNTHTDTEVLLIAFHHWGISVLPRLKGMFAFVVYDREQRKLTCVRDGFGIKPFFYYKKNETFVFSSEIRPIFALLRSKPELNWQRAFDYLAWGWYDEREQTFFKDVLCLMPGHYLEYDLKNNVLQEPRQWWYPSIRQTSRLKFQDAAEELRERFLNNIKLHLRSDVPWGCALSGGIDSSSVVCAIRHLNPDIPIHTFSFIASGQELSEEKWIDIVNDYARCTPHKARIKPQELISDIDEMILAQGEPFGSTSIYAQYKVFKLAKENGITVTLDGQGADELLAGYFGYPEERVKSLVSRGRIFAAWRFIQEWSKWPGRGNVQAMRYLMKIVFPYNIKASLVKLYKKTKQSMPLWIDFSVLQEAGVKTTPELFEIPHDGTRRYLMAKLRHALQVFNLPALLRHADRNSMNVSIESRVPFLTTDLAEFILSLPEEYLLSRHGETKHVFRAAMRGIVPDSILDRRDKIGFAADEQDIILQISPQVQQWLAEDMQLPFIKQNIIVHIFDKICRGEQPYNPQVWRWINFVRWYNLNFRESEIIDTSF